MGGLRASNGYVVGWVERSVDMKIGKVRIRLWRCGWMNVQFVSAVIWIWMIISYLRGGV